VLTVWGEGRSASGEYDGTPLDRRCGTLLAGEVCCMPNQTCRTSGCEHARGMRDDLACFRIFAEARSAKKDSRSDHRSRPFWGGRARRRASGSAMSSLRYLSRVADKEMRIEHW
jgi:hypothetical protein